ncbi:MAG: anti-phage dCTP deaminase [Micavibrio sp.]
MKSAPASTGQDSAAQGADARDVVRQLVSNEMVFAVVGPVGSGTSQIAQSLHAFLSDKAVGVEAEILKASKIIEAWATTNKSFDGTVHGIARTTALQDAGDEMRASDHAGVAVELIKEIRAIRARKRGIKPEKGTAVEPDGVKRAYIIDSLRNPAEAILLRNVYQESFCLIGVICDSDSRKDRLKKKYRGAQDNEALIEALIERDGNADNPNGQKVSDTFHLADFFVDNTASRILPNDSSNPEWRVMEELGRLVDILTHNRVVRPRPNETAMYHAYGARMRSACLSRQVGAALIDSKGDIVSTGTNEVPRAGGGVYGSVFTDFSDDDPSPKQDHRCAFSGRQCSNTKEQNDIIDELLANIEEFKQFKDNDDLKKKIRKTRIGQLIEFSRAVHAEMDALMSAARQGMSTVGTRLFVTTFPCHNCARHIVAAGVDEVQFIEPYLKSRALPLHGDAITANRVGWRPPSSMHRVNGLKNRAMVVKDGEDNAPQVLFRPFTGVAPRLYRRAFYKDRHLKDPISGKMLDKFQAAEGTGVSQTLCVSFADVEAKFDK